MTATLTPASPTQLLLGRELRAARSEAKMSADAAARRCKWSPSKISRYENGRVLPVPADLGLLIRLYKPDPEVADRLRELRDAAAEGREMPGYSHDPDIRGLLIWAPDMIPPALRTEDYARAVMRSVRRVQPRTSAVIKQEISDDRYLQARIRQVPLRPGLPVPPAVTLACVLDEAVLTRRRGRPEVMAAQLAQLEDLARVPGVELQVLPLAADGPAFGPFTYLEHRDDTADAVLLAGPAGTEQESDDQVALSYRFAFEDVQAAAADIEESLALIKQAAGQWS